MAKYESTIDSYKKKLGKRLRVIRCICISYLYILYSQLWTLILCVLSFSEELSDLKGQIKILDEKNTFYMEKNMELEEVRETLSVECPFNL